MTCNRSEPPLLLCKSKDFFLKEMLFSLLYNSKQDLKKKRERGQLSHSRYLKKKKLLGLLSLRMVVAEVEAVAEMAVPSREAAGAMGRAGLGSLLLN